MVWIHGGGFTIGDVTTPRFDGEMLAGRGVVVVTFNYPWVQFAKTGNPNGASLPQWPVYASPDYRVLEYGNEITVQSNAGNPGVDFFQKVFETMRQRKERPD